MLHPPARMAGFSPNLPTALHMLKVFPRGRMAVAVVTLGLAAVALGEEPSRAAAPAAGQALKPTVPQAREAARARLRDALGRTGTVQTDRRTGGVRVAAKLGGFLTRERKGASAARIALDYVKAHSDAFGLTAADLGTLELADTTRANGITHLRWVQRVDGVPFIDGDLRASVTSDGRLLQVSGGARSGLAQTDTTPSVKRADAIRAAGGTPGRDQASLVITTAAGAPRLAWRVIRVRANLAEDVLIDARTKQRLRRTDRLSDIAGTAYRNYPGAQHGGAAESVELDGWLRTPDPSDLSQGTQAAVSADLDGDGELDPGEEIRRKADGSFAYARVSWPGPFCPLVGCSWEPLLAFSQEVNKEHFGTQLFVSIHRFADHLAQSPIAFPGFGTTPISARVLVGADGRDGGIPVNNASMFTPPAPRTPEMRMHLFKDTGQGYISGHASDDASIVHHEHAHGMLARLVSDAQGWGALNLRQSKALDEGLADVYALDYLVGEGLIEDTAIPGEVRMAPFLDPKGAARTQPIDCPVGATTNRCKGGYTYADLGRVHRDGPEEHADGEVIAQALWDLRTRLDDTERFRLLLTAALRMVPAEPTFLDLRNAILLADTATGGTSRAQIWAAFAARGMGFYAASQDGNDVDVTESFELPPTGGTGALRGTVRDRDSGELLPGARVRLAGHETGDGELAGLRATTDENGEYAITGVPAGTYPGLTVERDGFETAVRDDVVVNGDDSVADVTLRKNWAHLGWRTQITAADGPDHTAEGCGPGAAFDGEALTGWAVESAPERSVTIWLPEDVRLTSVAIVPRPGCEQGAEALPASISVEASGARGLLWDEIGTLRPTAKGMHDPAELRPAAPLEGVRQVRVTLHARENAGPYVGLGDVRVFATANVAPRASFSWSPRTPDVGDTVALDARASTPGSYPIAGYRWDFDGDGRYDTPWSPSPDASDVFDTPGRRTVALQIQDANGETDTVRHTFWVGRDVEISDLGTLDGDTASRAVFPTTRGVIVGQSYVSGNANRQAARYRGGAWERLEPLHTGAGAHSAAYQANDAGQAVGLSAPSASGDERAVLWTGTTPTDLGTFGGRRGQALGINATGTIVGFAHDESNQPRAFIKQPGGDLRDIQELAGIPEDERTPSIATKVSDNGAVVGCLQFVNYACAGDAAFMFKDGWLTRLPSLDGTGNSSALHVADDGKPVGWSAALGGTHAVQWVGGVPVDLGTLGGRNSSAVATNGETIVGSAEDGFGRTRAVKWEDGRIQDLNELVQDTDWTLEEAEGINARGEVTGTGIIDGRRRAFMLNLGPCRVCVEDVRFEERDVPSGAWVETGTDGTVDGNLVRVTATVRNDDDQPHIFQLRFADQDAGEELPGSGETVTLNPGESKDVRLEWDTDGLAWDAGTPLPSRVVRVQARLGRTIYDTHRAALDIRPRPLVLVHGMLASAGTWSDYRTFAERAHPNWDAFAVGDGRERPARCARATGSRSMNDRMRSPATRASSTSTCAACATRRTPSTSISSRTRWAA
jgi:extracellular elastinolytic metalloproteinase